MSLDEFAVFPSWTTTKLTWRISSRTEQYSERDTQYHICVNQNPLEYNIRWA